MASWVNYKFTEPAISMDEEACLSFFTTGHALLLEYNDFDVLLSCPLTGAAVNGILTNYKVLTSLTTPTLSAIYEDGKWHVLAH